MSIKKFADVSATFSKTVTTTEYERVTFKVPASDVSSLFKTILMLNVGLNTGHKTYMKVRIAKDRTIVFRAKRVIAQRLTVDVGLSASVTFEFDRESEYVPHELKGKVLELSFAADFEVEEED